MNIKKLEKSEHTKGKEFCARLENDDYWVVKVESVEDCLDECKKHEHCQKANYYNYDRPPIQGKCFMYPIGAEKCHDDSHKFSILYLNFGEPDHSIECIPKRCRHGKNKHDCLKDAGPDGAFCHHSWREGDNSWRTIFNKHQMRCLPCKDSLYFKLGFQYNKIFFSSTIRKPSFRKHQLIVSIRVVQHCHSIRKDRVWQIVLE